MPRARAFNRTPAANRDAEDLALQCSAGQFDGGPIGKEADRACALCQQALDIDPDNLPRPWTALGVRRPLAFPATLKAISNGPMNWNRRRLALNPMNLRLTA